MATPLAPPGAVIASTALAIVSAEDVPLPATFQSLVKGLILRLNGGWQFISPPSQGGAAAAGCLRADWFDCETCEHVLCAGADAFTAEVYGTLPDGTMVLLARADTAFSQLVPNLGELATSVPAGALRRSFVAPCTLALRPGGSLRMNARTTLSHYTQPLHAPAILPRFVQAVLPPPAPAPAPAAPPAPALAPVEPIVAPVEPARSEHSEASFPFSMKSAKAASWVGFEEQGGAAPAAPAAKRGGTMERQHSAGAVLATAAWTDFVISSPVVPSEGVAPAPAPARDGSASSGFVTAGAPESTLGGGELGIDLADFVIHSGAAGTGVGGDADSYLSAEGASALGLTAGAPLVLPHSGTGGSGLGGHMQRTGSAGSGVSGHVDVAHLPGVAGAAWPQPAAQGFQEKLSRTCPATMKHA